MLRAILQTKEMSLYELEKTSSISHATLSDIYNEHSNIDKCSIAVINKIAKALHLSMDSLYDFLLYEDMSLFAFDTSFDLFKSNICHELKNLGDLDFLKKYLINNEIVKLYKDKEYPKSLYLLSLVDYLSKENNIPLASEYDEIRNKRLNKIYVSKSLYLLLKSRIVKVSDVLKECLHDFLKHNIVEAEIRNVI